MRLNPCLTTMTRVKSCLIWCVFLRCCDFIIFSYHAWRKQSKKREWRTWVTKVKDEHKLHDGHPSLRLIESERCIPFINRSYCQSELQRLNNSRQEDSRVEDAIKRSFHRKNEQWQSVGKQTLSLLHTFIHALIHSLHRARIVKSVDFRRDHNRGENRRQEEEPWASKSKETL
jgi:hypothetical protein